MAFFIPDELKSLGRASIPGSSSHWLSLIAVLNSFAMDELDTLNHLDCPFH